MPGPALLSGESGWARAARPKEERSLLGRHSTAGASLVQAKRQLFGLVCVTLLPFPPFWNRPGLVLNLLLIAREKLSHKSLL